MRVCVTALAVALGLGVVLAPASGRAETPPPFPDFTFKRVKPPAPGTTPRITVQIAPTEPAAPQETGRPDAPTASGSAASGDARHAWFWDALPPPGPAQGALRFQAALEAVSDAPVTLPRLERFSSIAAEHGPDILLSTVGTGVSPALVLAVIAVESGGRIDAVSGAGAEGLMQLMPATAARFGVADSTVAPDNIQAGVTYLDWLLKEFGGDPILALAGYNAGENAVKAAGDVPEYAETRAYVPKVLAAWTVARGLCRTPPELIGDGCVFVTGGNT